MKYTVTWKPQAERQLASIWLDAEDRASVTSAARLIDERLEIDPQRCGESREGNDRVFFVEHLGVYFELLRDDRRVNVISVWTIAK